MTVSTGNETSRIDDDSIKRVRHGNAVVRLADLQAQVPTSRIDLTRLGGSEVSALLADALRSERLAAQLEVAQPDRGAEDVHLATGIVDVILAMHVEADRGQQVGDDRAVGRTAAVADVQRAGRIGRHELDLDLGRRRVGDRDAHALLDLGALVVLRRDLRCGDDESAALGLECVQCDVQGEGIDDVAEAEAQLARSTVPRKIQAVAQ